MKVFHKQFGIVWVCIFLCLLGCTEKRGMEKLAVEAAREMVRKELKSEAEETILNKPEMAQNYVNLLTGQAKFEAKDIKIEGDQGQVTVVYSVVPKGVRTALMSIISSHDAGKDNNLNIIDAMKMIQTRQGLGPEAQEDRKVTMRLQKNKEKTEWQVQ